MEITDNETTEVMSRSSRSRSKTPAVVQRLEVERKKRGDSTGSVPDPKRRGGSIGPVTSTPNETAVTSTSLTAISESYSEIAVVTATKTTKTTKTRKSARQKSGVTNGKTKKKQQQPLVVEGGEFSSDDEKNETVQAYRNAGEWWNVFPKTDFSYSPASSFYHQEVSPGVHQLPNMSRPSLSTYTERKGALFKRATVPTIEKSSSTKARWDTTDSDFEYEDIVTQKFQSTSVTTWTRIVTWLTVVSTRIVQSCTWTTSASTTMSTPKKSGRSQEQPTYLEILLVHIYMAIARVVLWNTMVMCMLHSVRPQTGYTRNRALILLCLLPLLLFGGLYLAENDSSNAFSPLRPLLSETRSAASSAYAAVSGLARNASAVVLDLPQNAFAVASDLARNAYLAMASVGTFVSVKLPTTFIELFAPLYNLFSPLFDLQLTLPNIY